MAYTVSVYFLGKYRAAYFRAAHLHDALEAASAALLETDKESRNALFGWMIAGEMTMTAKDAPVSVSYEHGQLGFSISAADDFDAAFLRRLGEGLPPCPGLDYSRTSLAA